MEISLIAMELTHTSWTASLIPLIRTIPNLGTPNAITINLNDATNLARSLHPDKKLIDRAPKELKCI